MRFVHTSDWQVGKTFRFADDASQVLRDERLDAVTRLGQLARGQGAPVVLVAGDVYDIETPTEQTLRQPIERMRAFLDIAWHLVPGNHDPHTPRDPATTERLRRLARSILRRCAPEEIVAENPSWQVVNAWPYGDLYVLEQLWRRLGIGEVIAQVCGGRKFDFDVERALFAMVANRACAPCSKLYCYEQWLKEEVHLQGATALELQHLYRAMDFLEANRDAIEKAIYFRLADLLNLDVEIVFYDTTSLHFEVDDEDRGRGARDEFLGSLAAGRKTYPALRKRGHSKNGRFDAPQIVVGLAVTRDGFPVRHWIFPGNTVDVTTVERVKKDLQGWHLSRCVFVGDAGMVSKANLETLARGGGKYILCMPIHRGGEVAPDVITRPGRYQKVASNLEVKAVTVGDGERRRRYVVCYNPEEAERQNKHREQVLKELQAEIDGLRTPRGSSHSKRVCALRASARYDRYLRLTHGDVPRIDQAAVAAAERLDGKFVVHSNDDTLSAADLALGYKQLQRAEVAWRSLKSGLKLRPVFHWVPHRIHAHVALTVLSLLLERVAEQACGDTWRNIKDDLRGIKLAQLLSPSGTVWQVTEPAPDALKRLKSLQIHTPRRSSTWPERLDTRPFRGGRLRPCSISENRPTVSSCCQTRA